MLPNFIGIGVQRAATTWLYNCLSRHPEICLSEKKELHYFTANFSKGRSWYEGNFSHHKGEKILGEISPNYIYHEHAISRMHDLIPDAKLLVVFRNPIDRAFSAYNFFNHRYPGKTFAESLEYDAGLIERSLYAENLKMVWKYYARDQVKVMLYEDIERAPRKFLTEVFEFLGVDTETEINGAKNKYNRLIFPDLQKILYKARLSGVVDVIKKTPVGDWIRKKHSQSQLPVQTELSKELHDKLRREFSDDVRELEKLLARDLEEWLN